MRVRRIRPGNAEEIDENQVWEKVANAWWDILPKISSMKNREIVPENKTWKVQKKQFYHSEVPWRYRRIGFAAEVKSDSENPAALYKRCSAAKPRVCSDAGYAHLATKNKRETFFPSLVYLAGKHLEAGGNKRHAFDGRTYRRISNQIPIRDPMGSTIPEASGFLITIKRSLNQN